LRYSSPEAGADLLQLHVENLTVVIDDKLGLGTARRWRLIGRGRLGVALNATDPSTSRESSERNE